MKITVLVSSVAISLTAAAVSPIRANTPDMYGGDTNAWQVHRHRTFMKQVKAGGAPVVFIGDSITHFWEGKPAWNKYFASGRYRALNLGISADRTEHVLWRLTEGGELDGYEAKVILLMIGTNNSGQLPFESETPADTVSGIQRILAVIAEKQPNARIILTSIFPRGNGPNDSVRLRNDAVNLAIAKFADNKRIVWCDFSDKFLAPDGTLSAEIFPDRLHPNALGYEIWASSVIPLIERCLVAGKDEFIPSVWPSNPQHYSKHGGSAFAIPDAGFGIRWWDEGILSDHRAKIVANGNCEYDLVMVGDSITHRWARGGVGGDATWKKLSEKYRVLNLGVGGDRTQHVLWRLRNGELSGYRAKVFTLMIGTNNDINSWQWWGTVEGIKAIIDEIKAKHPESKIVLMPIFPRGASPKESCRVWREKVNGAIRSFADGKTVVWLDFNSKFLEPDGTLTKEMMPDLLHPAEKGYQIWYDALVPVVDELVGMPVN